MELIIIFCCSISSYISTNKEQYITALNTAVAIQSVSAWPDKRDEIQTMVRLIADKLRRLGTDVELADIGSQRLPNGKEIPLPNVILGTLGKVRN